MSNAPLTRRQLIARGGGASAGVFGLGAIFAACGGGGGGGGGTKSGGSPATTAGGSATWALSFDPIYMAPFGVAGNNYVATEFIYDSLVAWDKNLKLQPALAESYSTPDPRTYEFKLRRGVKFHDGSTLTAKDVLYSFKLQADPPPPGNDTSLSQFPAPDKVEAVDDYTVRIVMPDPDPRLLGYLAWLRYSAIVPEGMYEKINPRVEGIGTGPFKLVEYRPNDHVAYKRFPQFWEKGVPSLDQLTLKILPDEQGRVAALRSGEIQGCDVSPDIAKALESDSSIQIAKGLIAKHREIQFTIKKGESKPWHDLRVRQAINHAINRRELIDRVYSGNAEISSFVPAGYGDWPLPADQLESNYLKFDVDASRRLMAEAGMSGGFSAVMQVYNETPDMVQIGELLQQQLKEIKVDLKLQPMEVGTFVAANASGKFDLELTNRGMRGDVTGYFTDFDPTQPSYKVWFTGYKPKREIVALIHQGLHTVDTAKRVPIYHEAQQKLLTEALHIPLLNPYVFQAISKRLQGKYVSFTGFNTALRTAKLTA